MKKIYFLGLFLFLGGLTFAQSFGPPGGMGGGMPPMGGGERPGEGTDNNQSEYYITGRVTDEDGDPMEAVSVRLLSVSDSSLVAGTGTLSDEEGRFTISNLKRGEYILHLTFLGYKSYYQQVKLLRIQPSLTLSTIKMEPDAILLKEAVITAVTPPIVVKEDTIEYNADSYKTQPNAVVEDMLKKMPGIEVGDDGSITAQGKSVKKILVDGKEFFSDDPKVASKNLPANMVDKVQVVDRQSDESRFSGVDDGEEETVINLTVKKGMKQGWFGTAQAGGGTKMDEFDPMYELNAMANRFVNSSQYSLLGSLNNTNNQGATDLGSSMFSGSSRMMSGNNRGTGTSGSLGGNFNAGNESETFRFGGDVSYMGNDKEFISTSEQQNFLTNDSSSFVNKNGRNVNRSHSLNLNFRLRWEIDTLTTLEFMPRFGFNKSHLENNGFTETMGGYRDAELAARDSVNDQDSRSWSDAHGYNLSGRLSFSRAFKSDPRRKLSFSFNYSANRNEEDGESYDVFNFYRTGIRDSIRHQTDETISKGASYDVRATYVEPLSKHYYLNFVYQYRYNTSDGDAYTYNLGSDYNDKTYIDVDSLGNPIADTQYSDVSHSQYQTHRGEISLRGVYTKMNFNVGVNLEHQKRITEYLYGRNVESEDNPSRQNSLNFSPTLRLRYRINKYENLRFNYRGNSSQPSARQLQSVPDVTDPLNIYQGNPELKSSFTHNMSLRYNTYNPETYSSLSVDFSAKVLQNNISEKTTYNDDGGRTRTPENVNGAWNTSIRVFYNMPFKMNKKFSLNSNSRLSYDKSVGFVSLSSKSDAVENTSRQYDAEENLSLRYSSDIVSASVGGNYTYSSVVNTMQPDNNQSTMNFGARADLDVFLTCGVSIGTDCRYQGTAGYAEGYNQNKVIWNASIAYSFLQKKNATIRFKVYDILQQNTSIERRVSSSYIMDQETNTLGSYCMLYFAYQFNTLGKGGHGGDRSGRGGFGGPGGGGPGGGPGGGGPGGYGGFR